EPDAAAQERLLDRGLDGARGLLVVELAQLEPRLPALERALEELAAVAVVGVRVVEPPVVLARLLAVVEAPIEDLRRLARDLQHLGPVAELAGQVAGEQVGHVLPAIELAREAQELLRRQTLGGRLLEHAPVPAQRAVVVLELLLVEARDALGPGHALVRILDLQEADLPDLDQRRPVAAAGVDRL